ncbi:hypothetical protein QBC42DRAFT_281365 [Cladorrhinum samala]|uniref:Uncharacterized protein n=1 Tax=Cladorrhinum samala TaxID=585594 RepID=A0AAV9H7J8_9PEZI|nr:hypothetical protein QBC42DRAFT_281365 [Cladorrhinum samala]
MAKILRLDIFFLFIFIGDRIDIITLAKVLVSNLDQLTLPSSKSFRLSRSQFVAVEGSGTFSFFFFIKKKKNYRGMVVSTGQSVLLISSKEGFKFEHNSFDHFISSARSHIPGSSLTFCTKRYGIFL